MAGLNERQRRLVPEWEERTNRGSFTWHAACAPHVELSADRLTATCADGVFTTVGASVVYTPGSGQRSFQVEVSPLSLTANAFVGLVDASFAEWGAESTIGFGLAGYALRLSDGKKAQGADEEWNVPAMYADRKFIGQPVVIGVQVDMDSGDVSFSWNDRPLGVAFQGAVRGEVRPAVSLFHASARLEQNIELVEQPPDAATLLAQLDGT